MVYRYPYYYKYRINPDFHGIYESNYNNSKTNNFINHSDIDEKNSDFTSNNIQNDNPLKEKKPRYNLINLFNIDSDEPVFEMFGIRLYLDDLIILCLLFFLYQENVHDELLFIVLILLLLS